MAVPNLLTVSFSATTYSNPRRGFSFPRELYDAFGFHGGSKVALLVTSIAGKVIFCGTSKFISGPEITEAATAKHLGLRQKIRVTASRV